MKLSNQNKDELRSKIMELLEKVPDGQRIKLDKKVLEDLLFEVVVLNKEKGIVVKLPTWSGAFLKKIDLSEVSFSDVSWNMLSVPEEDLEYIIKEASGVVVTNDNAVSTIIRIIKGNSDRRMLTKGFIVSYRETNARIDLTKSFEALHLNQIVISSCNFLGVDFSQLNLTGIKSITLTSTDISGTKLFIPSNVILEAYYSNLVDIDLSNRKIDACQYLLGEYANLGNCDLTNCGVQVILNPEDFKDSSLRKDLNQALCYELVGCYINGKKVLSDEEKQKLVQDKREEYEAMKDGMFASITDNIEEQIGKMGK